MESKLWPKAMSHWCDIPSICLTLKVLIRVWSVDAFRKKWVLIGVKVRLKGRGVSFDELRGSYLREDDNILKINPSVKQ